MAGTEIESPLRNAEETIETLFSAIEANLRTPARRGNLIDLEHVAEGDVLISADLHGHLENFARILRLADLDAHPLRHLILQEVCHGGPTYLEGGCRSHRMLEEVAELKVRHPDRVHFLLSNHELAELTDFPITKDGKLLALPFRMGIGRAYPDAVERMHAAYQAFIGSCPLGVVLPGRVLVTHSAPAEVDRGGFDTDVFDRPWTPADLNEGGAVYRLVWGRDYRAENVDAFAARVGMNYFIHGHTPCAQGFNTPNERQLILDCCGSPAACCLLPLTAPLDADAVLAGIAMLE